MKALNQLKTFERILSTYPADMPLGKFLPGFYRQNKQMGSTDRRIASRLVYNYFRLGRALPQLPVNERLLVAEFLCNIQINSFISHFKPEWAALMAYSIDDKLQLIKQLHPEFELEDVFPFSKHCSAGLNTTVFLKSIFIQPDLYIRVIKKYEALVKNTLTAANITFKDEGNNCLSLPNGTRLEHVLPNQQWYEVQDYSSQQTAQWFKPNAWEHWWDACAASGGKSLLLHQLEPSIKLVVSDVRESILVNLDERFQQAGILKYQRKVLDLTQNADPEMHHYAFDGIILDAPCTGSGTWGRTPEMISQFEDYKIANFARLQQSIIANVLKYLKPGQPLIYITCSAFKAENEDQVAYMVANHGLQLEHMQLLTGYERKADTMFVARLIKKG